MRVHSTNNLRITDVSSRIYIWWRLTSSALRAIVIAITTSMLALGAYSILRVAIPINSTAASVLVAVVFGAVTIFQQRQSQRRQFTIDLMKELISSDRIASATAWIAKRVIVNKPVTEDLSAAERAHVIAALDCYELIAGLGLRGLIDISIILDMMVTSMTRDFYFCKTYIDHRRSTNAPNLYERLEKFVSKYASSRLRLDDFSR